MCWFLQYFLYGIFFPWKFIVFMDVFVDSFFGSRNSWKGEWKDTFFLDISLCMMFFFRNLPMYELFLIFTWTTSKHRSLSNGSSLIQRINCLLLFCNCILTLYSITSVCIFSILLPRHFLRLWQGEFVQQSRASLVGDHLLYSHDLDVWFRGDVVWRNWKLVTLRS